MRKKPKTTFVLDIGTRTIVGLLMENCDEGVIIKEIVNEEHGERAMLHGQIHNIPQVSLLLKKIKSELEQRSGLKLKKVAVAAAGRSLKTVKTTCHVMLDKQQPIKKEDVLNLELKGAQKAQALLLEENKLDQGNEFYCVGYSVTKYYLDDSEIGSLISQKGNKAGLEIVAAFLPKVVVDSLQAVLLETRLELANITLEPIAAINAILPPSIRKLNLALVDIGAGTSDIAISFDGSIIAYGMVPIAGDEITEALCDKYLLDFHEAENLKRKLHFNLEGSLTFCDILGIEHTERGQDVIEKISEAIKILADNISNEILNLNSKPPQAVVLIGGGSLTPFLTEYLAERVGLSKQRVAVQKASSIKDVLNLPEKFQGPEIITPIGIGLTALKHLTLGFIPVQVNDYHINLLNLGKNTVLNALLAAGIHTGQVYGRPGRGLTVEVNGKIKTFPGTLGQKAKIKLNNIDASLDALLKPRDKIEYIPAQDGEPGRGWAKDLIASSNWVKINGEIKELPVEIVINGLIKSPKTELGEGDKIFLRNINQVGELLEYWNLIDYARITTFTVIINGNKKEVTNYPFKIKRNGKNLSLFDELSPQEEIIIAPKDNSHFSVEEILASHTNMEKDTYIEVKVNNETVKLSNFEYKIKINGFPGKLKDLIKDKDLLEVNYQYNAQHILIDIFRKLNFSTTPPPGYSSLEILLNNKDAEYISPLKAGDNIILNWK